MNTHEVRYTLSGHCGGGLRCVMVSCGTKDRFVRCRKRLRVTHDQLLAMIISTMPQSELLEEHQVVLFLNRVETRQEPSLIF